jgi:hypothetical protein
MTSNGNGPERVEVDLSGLTIEDMIFIEEMGSGAASAKAMVEFLDRLVVGGARHRPLSDLREIVEAISTHASSLVTSKN